MSNTHTTHTISFYTKGKFSKPSKSVDRFDIYKSIEADYIEETQYIQKKYGVEIGNNFPDGKKEYQADKKSLLNGVCFSGNIDRSNMETFLHNGIINLDIDENTPDELKRFFSQVPNISFIEAAARSVSHVQSGAFWVNAKIEIPTNWSCISIKLRNLLGLKRDGKKDFSYQDIEIIHKSYHEALTELFKGHGIKVGTAKDVKRIRYLTNDSSIYVNDKAEVYTLKALELILSELNKKDESKTFNRVATNINKSDAFDFATEFALKSTGEYAKGNRHYFLVAFSIACNRLGVPETKVRAYIDEHYTTGKGNYLEFPYKKYKKDFGVWKHKIYKKGIKAFKTFNLKKGQYISDIYVPILDTYLDCWTNEIHNLWDWKAGTGSGKSTAVATKLAPALKEFTGHRSIIIYPLNSLTEKQAIKYGAKWLTGEVLNPNTQQEALNQDIIFCNQNTFPRLVQHFESKGETFHLFFDESHDLPNGTNYKFDVVSEVWHKKERIAASVTLLSGTPTDYFSELGFKRLEFIQTDRPKIKVVCKEMVQAPDLTTLNHCKESDNDKQVLLQLQSKKSIDNITQLLGIDLDKEQVLKFYSESHIKQQSYYQDLIKASANDNSFRDARFVFCTSFINTGIDVYCNNKAFEGVYINKEFNHHLTDFLQFSDRWRTDKDKTVYYYYKGDKIPKKIEELTAIIDELKDENGDLDEFHNDLVSELEQLQALKAFQEKEYNARYEFKRLLKEYRYRADYYNRKINSLKSDTIEDAYKTEISETNFFIIEDNQVFVNEMYLMKLVHKKAQKNITFKRFKQRIEQHFPYVELVEENEVSEAPIGLKDDLKELKKINQENKEKAQDKIYQLLVSPFLDVFLQAIRIKTNCSEFKKLVRPNLLLKQQALDLIKDNQLLFDRYLCHAVTSYKRIKELQQLHLTYNEAINVVFKVKKSGLTKMLGNRGYSSFIQRYKIQILLYLQTLEVATGNKILNTFQRNDAKRYQAFIKAIANRAQESKISAKDILFAALGVWNKRRVGTTGITQRIAVSMFRSVYKSKYSNHLYNIDEKQPLMKFKNVFDGYKIDSQNIKNKIAESVQKNGHNLLITN